MTVQSAMGAAVSGMNAQSAQLSSISNNIANSSTVGYKQTSTDFENLVFGATPGACGIPGGVSATNRMDISTAGQLQNTGVNTDIAVSGKGFLVVNTRSTSANGDFLLTRAGSFRPDANGDLVNANGYYLQGEALGPTGAPLTPAGGSIAALSTVNVSNLTSSASPTSAMTFTANLPASDTAGAATAPAPSSSTMAYYDGLGTAQSLRFEFVPTVPAAGSPASNTWTMNVYDSAGAAGTAIASATLAFNASGDNAGTLSSVSPVSGGAYDATAGTFTITNASGQSLPITIGALNSATGMTQFDGDYQTTRMSQNGAPFGTLTGVNIGEDGKVNAAFSNGTSRAIYQLDLVTLPNPDGLIAVSGSAFRLSQEAGLPQLHNPGDGTAGTTQAGALEGSNVDLTAQLTNMIATQRAYSSNAMVVQTASQMLDTVNRLNG